MTPLKRELRRLLREYEEDMRASAGLAKLKEHMLKLDDPPYTGDRKELEERVREHDAQGQRAALVVEVLKYLDSLPNSWLSRLFR